MKVRGHVRFVHRFRNWVPSRRKSLGTSASSCKVSDMLAARGEGSRRWESVKLLAGARMEVGVSKRMFWRDDRRVKAWTGGECG
jgi:hypothetical protein